MPRDMKARENQKRARALRERALARTELGRPTEARVSPTGVISAAIKAEDPVLRAMIDDALAKQRG